MNCHRVERRRLARRAGPDAHRAAAPLGRSRALAGRSRRRKCCQPAASIASSPRTARRSPGRLLNIDTFTVQMIDTKEQLRSFTKANLREHGFIPSPMPSFKSTLQRAGARRRRQLSGVVEGQGHSMTRRTGLFAVVAAVVAVASLQAQVTFDRILRGRSRAAQLAVVLGHTVQSAIQPADADHARRTPRTSSCSGSGRRDRSRSSRPRRSSSMACSTPCRRPTTSWRSMPRPAVRSGRRRTRRRRKRGRAADA